MTLKIVKKWTVGTHPDCGVRVNDEYASMRHCEVALTEAGTYVVRDWESLNGTWIRRHATVNALGEARPVDVRVHDWTAIQPGDSLVVGRSEIPWAAPKGDTDGE